MGKREPAPPDASQLYGANEHKCHCQAEMKNKRITTALKLEDNRARFAYEERQIQRREIEQ